MENDSDAKVGGTDKLGGGRQRREEEIWIRNGKSGKIVAVSRVIDMEEKNSFRGLAV